MLMLPRVNHKNASSFHSSHLLKTTQNERKSYIMLIITIRNNKASWTSQSNTHKPKGVLFLILDYGSCFLYLLATLLVITSIFSAFVACACMYGQINCIAGTCQAVVQRESLIFCHYMWISWYRWFDVFSMATTKCIGLMTRSNMGLLFVLLRAMCS